MVRFVGGARLMQAPDGIGLVGLSPPASSRRRRELLPRRTAYGAHRFFPF